MNLEEHARHFWPNSHIKLLALEVGAAQLLRHLPRRQMAVPSKAAIQVVYVAVFLKWWTWGQDPLNDCWKNKVIKRILKIRGLEKERYTTFFLWLGIFCGLPSSTFFIMLTMGVRIIPDKLKFCIASKIKKKWS